MTRPANPIMANNIVSAGNGNDSQQASSYGSRTISIAVGKNSVIFNVHDSRLRKFTVFFEKHGELPVDNPSTENRDGAHSDITLRTAVAQDDAQAAESNGIKAEDTQSLFVNDFSSGASILSGATAITTATLFSSSVIHYKLDGYNYSEPKAFQVIVNWLYNEHPGTIKTRREVQISLKAYVLALDYKAYTLQNMLLDRFQDHYARNRVKFDDLVWVINRVEDNNRVEVDDRMEGNNQVMVHKPTADTKSALTSYLIEQVAYEISDNGFDDFAKDNWFFVKFLEEGDRKHRVDLVQVLAGYALRGKPIDPALAKQRFHVETAGVEAGLRKKLTERWGL